MDIWLFLLIIVGCLLGLMALGLPIAFTMAGVAIFGTILTWGWSGLFMVVSSTFGNSTNFIYVAIPLFLLMANFLQNSGLADDMYEIIYRWAGGVRGGLAMGTVVICAIFGAMSGISSAATVTMGLIALPSMLQRGYDKSMVLGCIIAGGALGILIPPSIMMIVYAGVAEVSVGKLFMAGVMPGILLAALYMIYIGVRCWLQPQLGPAVDVKFSLVEKLVILKGAVLPVLLVLLVLGTIYTGICTPTEAAGVGALGALACMAVYRRLTMERLKSALLFTITTNAMVMWIVIGAACFSHFFAVAGIHDEIHEAMVNLDIWRWWVIIIMQVIFLILGMFLNAAAIVTLLGPLFVPIILKLGFDPVWFGILFVINMEMGYLTPPFGFNLFVLKGVVPKDISMTDIYRSIIPFVAIQMLCLAIVMAFPKIAMWLPGLMKVGS